MPLMTFMLCLMQEPLRIQRVMRLRLVLINPFMVDIQMQQLDVHAIGHDGSSAATATCIVVRYLTTPK